MSAFDDLVQQVQDLQDQLQEIQDDQQTVNDDIENRVETLENPQVTSPNDFPLDTNLQAAIEQAIFNTLTAVLLRGGLPIYTVARNTTQTPPVQGEIWLEDISGTRKICVWISGIKYTVTVT